MIMVGRTPVLFMIKQQGKIEMRMHSADFCNMWNAVEDVESVKYMLNCI